MLILSCKPYQAELKICNKITNWKVKIMKIFRLNEPLQPSFTIYVALVHNLFMDDVQRDCQEQERANESYKGGDGCA